jgi:hypothetical protein
VEDALTLSLRACIKSPAASWVAGLFIYDERPLRPRIL